MYDMFWKASAFKQTIPEEWKNKGDLWGLLTPEKQRTADKGGYFFLFSSRGLSKQQGQIQVATKGATRREEPNGRFFPGFVLLCKRAYKIIKNQINFLR